MPLVINKPCYQFIAWSIIYHQNADTVVDCRSETNKDECKTKQDHPNTIALQLNSMQYNIFSPLDIKPSI